MTAKRENPIPSHWVADGLVSEQVQVAHDAFEEHRADALQLMVGLPATISVGSDSYAAKVIRATPKTLVVSHADDYADRGAQVYRLTKRGWRHGRSLRLVVGRAIDHRDPSF